MSQAMILMTKLQQGLDAYSGTLNKLNIASQLKLCEIELSLNPYVYDSFKRLNQIFPQILENGTKEL